MLIESEKSHSPPFASWRPRKAGGTGLEWEQEGAEARTSDVSLYLNLKA